MDIINTIKPVGLIRNIDSLLRVTIPVEYRKAAGLINSGIKIKEFYAERYIVVAKADRNCKRKVDTLGRIRVSIKSCEKLGWNIGDSVEIQLWSNGALSIKKADPM